MANAVKVSKGQVEIDPDAEDMLSKFIDGCQGKITIFGNEITKVKKGNVIREHKPITFERKKLTL